MSTEALIGASGATTGGRRRAQGEAALFLAALSWAAAMIHSVVAVPHFDESNIEGGLFVLTAAFQAAWGIWVYCDGGRRPLISGATVNAAIIGAWAISRTVGLPGGSVEPVGLADLGAVLAEAALCFGCVALARRNGETARMPPWGRQAALSVLIFAGVALLTAGHHH